MAKESLKSVDSRVIFRSTFNSFDDVAKDGGVLTNATINNGVLTFNGTTSNLYYTPEIITVGTVRMKIKTTSIATLRLILDFRYPSVGGTASGTGFIYKDTNSLALAVSTGTVYINGVANINLPSGAWADIVVSGMTISTGTTSAMRVGSFGASNVFNGDIEIIEIYKGTLTATEVAELYKNDLYTFPQSAKDYTFNFNCLNGYLNDSKGATITNTGASVTNDGGVNVLLPTTTSTVLTNRAISSLFSASTCTISVWCRPTGIAPTRTASYDGQDIVIDSDGGATGGYISISRTIIGGNDRIWVNVWDGVERKVGITYNNDEWVNIVLVHTGGQLYGYKNGVLVSNVAAGNIQVVSELLRIGTKYTATPPVNFAGRIGEVNTWNRALTQTEITRLYNSQKNRYV